MKKVYLKYSSWLSEIHDLPQVESLYISNEQEIHFGYCRPIGLQGILESCLMYS